MKALDYLVKNKLVRYIGVSNFSIKLLKEAQSYTKNKIIADQVEYNFLYRAPERDLLKYCQENKIFLIAYKPLCGGKLIDSRNSFFVKFSKKHKKTRIQLSLNWLISKDNVIAIPKSSTAKHIRENASAAGWRWDDLKL